MSGTGEQLFEIAEQTRADFRDGRVSRREIVSAALSQSLEYWIMSQQADKYLLSYDGFPEASCTIASIVLSSRVNAAQILGNAATFIPGGFHMTDGSDPPLNTFHAVVGAGETDLGRDTILCVTAGQFPGMPDRSYVGPLQEPWTRTPGEPVVPMSPLEMVPALVGAR